MTVRRFVLVHGAFHGGWCWQPVRDRLEAAGHRVYAPSLTGSGDRAHLLTADITITTYVNDIANLIEGEQLDETVLVGHSFGCRVVAGVADRLPHRLARLVFLDGGFPESGRSRLSTMAPEVRAARIAAAQAYDGGISVPPPPGTAFGLRDPEHIAWVEARLTPQPLGADASALTLEHELGNGVPATYVRFVDPPFAGVLPSAEYARQRADWSYLELGGGHDAIVTRPDDVAAALLAVAATPPGA